MRKRDHWRDARTAAEYDGRRFRSPLQRLKHLRDERLLLALLARHGEVGPHESRGGPRVLDMPCGTGRFFGALTGAGARVVGADVSLAMIRAIPVERASWARVQASAFELPFSDDAFAAALCVRFLFHLDGRDERVAVLRELARTTTGPVIGQVRTRANLKHLGRWLRARLGLSKRYRPSRSRAEIERELSDAGLELVGLRAVSRLFSDKSMFVGRRRSQP